jgi:hypothetical protein
MKNTSKTIQTNTKIFIDKSRNSIELIREVGQQHIEELVENEMERIDSIVALYDELESLHKAAQLAQSKSITGQIDCRVILVLLGKKELAYDFIEMPAHALYRTTYQSCRSYAQFQNLMNMIVDLCISRNRETRRVEYLENYKLSAWGKLDNAINKHINADDTSIWAKCFVGPKGLEIYADVNGTHVFDTKCVLAGGWIQQLHYRYLSHLKVAK